MKEKFKNVVKKFWKVFMIFVIVCMAYVAGVITRSKFGNNERSFFDRNRKEIMEKLKEELGDETNMKNVKVSSEGNIILVTADMDEDTSSWNKAKFEIFEGKVIAYQIAEIELDSTKWCTYLGDEYTELRDLQKED